MTGLLKAVCLAIISTLAAADETTAHQFEVEVVRLLNAMRKKGHMCKAKDPTKPGITFEPNEDGELKMDCRLRKSAFLHAKDMAVKGYFSHHSPDGEGPGDRAKKQGVSGGGENVARGQNSPAHVVTSWSNSEGHCINMMNPNYTIIGVGFYQAEDKYKNYWVQQLAGRFDEAAMPLQTGCLESPEEEEPAKPEGEEKPTKEGEEKPTEGFDPTKCTLTGVGEKCAKCVTKKQCEDAYGGDEWYCCPYMKKCVNSESMSCTLPIARCTPSCFDQTMPIDCPGCSEKTFPNQWIDGCQDGPAPIKSDPECTECRKYDGFPCYDSRYAVGGDKYDGKPPCLRATDDKCLAGQKNCQEGDGKAKKGDSEGNGKGEKGDEKDKKPAKPAKVPAVKYGKWGSFSKCNVSCGTGTRTRERGCSTSKADCEAKKMTVFSETKKCKAKKKCVEPCPKKCARSKKKCTADCGSSKLSCDTACTVKLKLGSEKKKAKCAKGCVKKANKCQKAKKSKACTKCLGCGW